MGNTIANWYRLGSPNIHYVQQRVREPRLSRGERTCVSGRFDRRLPALSGPKPTPNNGLPSRRPSGSIRSCSSAVLGAASAPAATNG